MQQIFTEQEMTVGGIVTVTGEDARHLAMVLRMKPGELVRVSTAADPLKGISQAESRSFLCEITELSKEQVTLVVREEMDSTELFNRIYLFQALPKGDRMETVIEKAVELGVSEIIPVEMKYCVVRLDEKKKQAKMRRYQAIAQSAAKQSKRSVIPRVCPPVPFAKALEMAAQCDVRLLPYECQEGMEATNRALSEIAPGKSISIMIGPEGGFAEEEIAAARQMDMRLISLGKRILRTDTAAIAAAAMVAFACETAQENMEAKGIPADGTKG